MIRPSDEKQKSGERQKELLGLVLAQISSENQNFILKAGGKRYRSSLPKQGPKKRIINFQAFNESLHLHNYREALYHSPLFIPVSSASTLLSLYLRTSPGKTEKPLEKIITDVPGIS